MASPYRKAVIQNRKAVSTYGLGESHSSSIAPCGQTLAQVPQLMHVSGSIW